MCKFLKAHGHAVSMYVICNLHRKADEREAAAAERQSGGRGAPKRMPGVQHFL
jgi:hypothetical protein